MILLLMIKITNFYNKVFNKSIMDKAQLEKVTNIVDSINDTTRNIKRIKNENGLIERIEIDKVVLTEDNKMLLKD